MLRKLVVITVYFFLSTIFLFAQGVDTEKDAVKKVIQSSYIDGLHNKGELSDIEKGFHPGFVLLGVKDNSLTQYPIYTWIESFNKRKNADPTPLKPEQKMVCEYLQIDTFCPWFPSMVIKSFPSFVMNIPACPLCGCALLCHITIAPGLGLSGETSNNPLLSAAKFANVN